MDKSIIPSMPEPVRKPDSRSENRNLGSLAHNRDTNPYTSRAYDPRQYGAHGFPSESAGLSHHYGAPRSKVPQAEIFKEGMVKKETVKAKAPKERNHISRRELIRKLEGKVGGTTKWRKELAKRLGIGNIWDPRVAEQVKVMVKKVKGIYGDDLISKYQFKKALGGIQHGRYFEELRHKQERLSGGKVTLEERRYRDREEIGHKALQDFAEEMFGLPKE